jgi:hypothetical protein
MELPFTASQMSIEEMMSKGLSDTVACLFSPNIPVPYAKVKLTSVSQELQPIPAKWTKDVPIEDEGIFFEANEEGPDQEGTRRWSGEKFFESAVKRLGLSIDQLARLADKEDEVLAKYGNSVADLSKAKRTVKNELKEYDIAFKSENGREPSRVDKEPMRLLYTLYRKIREIVVRLESNSSTAAPAVASPQILRASQERASLEERLEALLAEKQQLRTVLHDYQTKFVQEQGRRIKYHRDIVAIDREYRQYKQVKEDISKLEAQLGRTSSGTRKQSSTDFFL